MRKDMHSNIKVLRAIEPKAVGTTGIANGALSAILDRMQGGVMFRTAEFIVSHGSGGASVADTTSVVIYEAAATGDSFTSVADADLIGTEAAVGCPAENPRTSGVGKNKTASIGYRGNKRYLKIRVYGVGHATGVVSAQLLLGNPELAPVT